MPTLLGGISSKDPSSENDILLYSLLADNRLCSVTALFNIVEPIEKNHELKTKENIVTAKFISFNTLNDKKKTYCV